MISEYAIACAWHGVACDRAGTNDGWMNAIRKKSPPGAKRVAESDCAASRQRRCGGEAESDGLATGTRNAVDRGDRKGDSRDLTSYRWW